MDINKLERKKIIKITFLVLAIFIVLAGSSYAYFKEQLQGTKNQVLKAGTLSLELIEDNEITISDAFPIADEVGMLNEEKYDFRLINNGTEEVGYKIVIQEVETGTLAKENVRYGLIKDGVLTKDYLSNLSGNVIDSGTIAGKKTIEYTLRLWIREDLEDTTQFETKTLTLRLSVSVAQQLELPSPAIASGVLFDEQYVGENCATYNDGVDTFLVGQCSQNYVWYSGKLWRVVLKNNETGAVKMVTDNAITSIPYNASGNTAFANSYMDQWLNQEFLSTLHDYEDYLVTNSIWDATTDSSSKPARPAGTTTVERTVGLLNAYEYYTTYNKSNGLATYSNGYLNNGVNWLLITPYDTSNVRIVHNSGTLSYDVPSYGNGARPSVNLKSTIQIDSGSGSKSNPYILKGDQQETVGGTTLLSTRYSGEYITFNNELYRIVGVENGLTKITAVDKPSSLASNMFHSASGVTSFANADIKTDLETYYQGLKTTNETAFNMIQPNTTWYLGTVGDSSNGNYHYKASICASIDASVSMNACTSKATSTTASIALPRVGEMFTSQITRGSKAKFWTLTPYSTYYVRGVNSNATLYYVDPTNGHGARPSMYLKSTIKIASGNTGNGTYEYPYSIEIPATPTYIIYEDFSDEEIDSNLTLGTSNTWEINTETGRYEDTVGRNSRSMADFTITCSEDCYLSFDWGTDGTDGGLYILLTPAGGTDVPLVSTIELTDAGTITKHPLSANITYTLEIGMGAGSDSGSSSRSGYIDNLIVE